MKWTTTLRFDLLDDVIRISSDHSLEDEVFAENVEAAAEQLVAATKKFVKEDLKPTLPQGWTINFKASGIAIQ